MTHTARAVKLFRVQGHGDRGFSAAGRKALPAGPVRFDKAGPRQ